MGKGDAGRCIFPLTIANWVNLQVKLMLVSNFQLLCTDLQSYLSDLSLFLAPESKKFYILVDNRPWLGSRSAHLWQLMVTKHRCGFKMLTRAAARKLFTNIRLNR
ncbi:unnamed protein product [Prunus armeniaca]